MELPSLGCCPKCGYNRGNVTYKSATKRRVEHLRVRCARCGYTWKTAPQQ